MEGALAWIGKLAEFFGQFFPRWVILATHTGGVKYVSGSRVVKLGPGIHWYWPVTTMIETYPIVTQTDNLPSQTMETVDGIPFTVGGMITYSVEDVEKLLTKTHSGVKMIQAITLAATHEVCCRMTWEQLKTEQRKGTLDTKLRNAAQKPLQEFGVKVEDCQLTDLARARVYRLIQSTQNDDS